MEKSLREKITNGSADCSFGRASLSLTEKGLHDISPGSETTYHYSAIQSIEYDGDTTYIYVRSSRAYIIPSSAFADSANGGVTRDEFVNALNEKIAEAKAV